MNEKDKNKNKRNKKNYTPKCNDVNPKGKEKVRSMEAPVGAYSKEYTLDEVRGNNIEWWDRSPLFPEATQIGFDTIFGSAKYIRSFSTTSATAATVFNSNIDTPGVLVVHFNPSIGSTAAGGNSSPANSAANRAFKVMYAALTAKTSGNNLGFQQADLAMYLTSMDSIAFLIAFVKRAVGISNVYTGYNYNYPDTILRAMHIKPASVIGRQDEIVRKLNSQIRRFNTMMLPRYLMMYDRHYSMCHEIYADEDDQRAQLYLFIPDGYYKYSDTDMKCQYLNTGLTASGPALDIDAILTIITDCIDVWYDSSDLGLINGALQRAFSDRAIIQDSIIDPDYVVKPRVDRNTLLQIMNSTALTAVSGLDITQDPEHNNLVYSIDAPLNAHNMFTLMDAHPLRMDTYSVTKNDIMEATRLMPTGIIAAGSQTLATKTSSISCGTEFVTGYEIFYPTFSASGVKADKFVYVTNIWQINATNWTTGANTGIFSRFKYAPVIWPAFQDTSTGAIVPGTPIMSLMNITSISAEQLTSLHEAALQSAYEVVPVLDATINMKR